MKHKFTDYWSLVHLFMGFMFVYINKIYFKIKDFKKLFLISQVLHLLYETKDYILTYNKDIYDKLKDKFPLFHKYGIIHSSNTITNSFGDHFYFTIGFLSAYYLKDTHYLQKGAFMYLFLVILGVVDHLYNKKYKN